MKKMLLTAALIAGGFASMNAQQALLKPGFLTTGASVSTVV